MSTIMSFPPEIIEQIVDALVLEDKQLSSLKAFSLVCHDTLPLCRKHLFATISLFNYRKNNMKTASCLLELLRVTPELCPLIRAVVYIFGADEPSRDLSTLPVISQKLTKLQSLHMDAAIFVYSVRWNKTPHRYALLALLHLPTITHLKLELVDGFCLSDLIPCVGLKNLEIYAVEFNDQPVGLSVDHLQPIALNRLSIGGQDSESLQALQGARRPDGKPIIDLAILKILHIRVRNCEELREMAEYLGDVRHLEGFELELTRSSPSLDGVYDILIRSSETLKHLKFSLCIYKQQNPIPALSQVLQKLDNNHNAIENIRIIVRASSLSAFERGDGWRGLDDTLSNGGWPALRYVSLTITAPRDTIGELKRDLLKMRETHFVGLATSSAIQFQFDVEPRPN